MARFFGLVSLFLILGSSAISQTAEFPWAIRAGGGMLRYYAHPSTTPLSGTTYYPAIEVGASKYLAGGFDFRTHLSIAPKVSFPTSGERFVNGQLIDMNYLLAFKFNNGVFFRESALIGPYLLFGVGGSYVENNPDVYLPLGGGLNVRINPRMSVRVETVRKISVNKENQNLAHALAFIYNLGSGSEIPEGTLPKEIEEELVAASLMPRDSDLDGIVDHEDDCPNHPGSVQFLGCPSSNQSGEDAYAVDETSPADSELDLNEEEAFAGQEEMSFDAMDELGLLAEEKPSSAQVETANSLAQTKKPAKTPISTPVATSDLASKQAESPSKATKPAVPQAVSPPAEEPTYASVLPKANANPEPTIQTPPAPAIAEKRPNPTPAATSPCSQQPLPSADEKPIFFSYGSHELQGSAKDQLKELAELMQSCEEIKLVLEGHTDDIGTENDNLVLSIMRAFNVKYHLVYEYGISQSRISSKGLGELDAASQHASASAREKNRRVEYSFVL